MEKRVKLLAAVLILQLIMFLSSSTIGSVNNINNNIQDNFIESTGLQA